jgi:magnesium chelatase family protein
MPSKVYSAAVVGVDAYEVEIEVHASWGNLDRIAIVGLPDTAVKESKDRVTSAISNSSLRWPYGRRITINLAPADVRKEGPSFDLPIALGMLQAEVTRSPLDLFRRPASTRPSACLFRRCEKDNCHIFARKTPI